MEDSI